MECSVFEISLSTDVWLTNGPPGEDSLSRHIRWLICVATRDSCDIEHLTKWTCRTNLHHYQQPQHISEV